MNPLPLEQTDPELAEHIRLIANGKHPVVRGFWGTEQGRVYRLHDGSRVAFRRQEPKPYDPCPCGSGKKFKWCCKGP